MPAQENYFPCQECGAKLHYSAQNEALKCSYCGHLNPVDKQYVEIVEKDYNKTLALLNTMHDVPPKKVPAVKCPSCAATFSESQTSHASDCPYCGEHIVNDLTEYRPIQVQAILPFGIEKDKAFDQYQSWIKGLWFAPSDLKQYAMSEKQNLLGIYIPYWTFDAKTDTEYRGERGTKRSDSSDSKMSWRKVSGSVQKSFDDVLAVASDKLPKNLTNKLLYWDLDKLIAYEAHYMSGYSSELYTVDLEAGFEYAKSVMQYDIRQKIKHDIGGDDQRITYQHTDYNDVTYKLIQLPIWSSSFRYKNKSFSFVINAQSGRVVGERPFSWIKILAAITAVVIVIAGAYVVYNKDKIFAKNANVIKTSEVRGK